MKERLQPAMRVTLLPRDTNRHGTIFGGVILSYIDLAGAIEARETCGSQNFVTVAMDKIIFHKPVFVGDVVSFYTDVMKIGNSSITIKVSVEAKRESNNETVSVTEAEVVFVAVDQEWKPVSIRKCN